MTMRSPVQRQDVLSVLWSTLIGEALFIAFVVLIWGYPTIAYAIVLPAFLVVLLVRIALSFRRKN